MMGRRRPDERRVARPSPAGDSYPAGRAVGGTMTLERKVLPLVGGKVNDTGPGSFSGYGSLFGELDSQGDRVMRGTYAATLPQFLERGFIAWGHDWLEPVA